MLKPHSIIGPDGTPIQPPEGVTYTGSRSEGPFIVLRFANTAYYCDRFYDASGKEVFRETGEVAPDPEKSELDLLREHVAAVEKVAQKAMDTHNSNKGRLSEIESYIKLPWWKRIFTRGK